MTATSERNVAPADWPAILAVFAMVIAFTYTDDLVEFIVALTGLGAAAGQWLVAGLDLLLVASTAFLKWRITARHESGGRLPFMTVLRGLLRSWWLLGAVLIVVLHVLVISLSDNLGQGAWLWTSVPLSTLFVIAMGLVLVSTLGSGPVFGAGAWARNGWIVPLMVGTFVVQVASAAWFPVIDTDAACGNEVSAEFFNQMVQVIPLLLVTLGIEMNFLRRTRATHHPGLRAAPILTVVLLCVAESLAFSMLVKAGVVHCGIAAVWHEYASFVVTIQATAIALATLVWLLVSDPTSSESDPV